MSPTSYLLWTDDGDFEGEGDKSEEGVTFNFSFWLGVFVVSFSHW